MIELLDQNDNENYVQEGESANVVATFEFDGVTFDKAALLTLTASLYDLDTKTVINSRNNQDVLDVNDGTVAVDGTFTIRFDANDNVIVSEVDEGSTEVHVLRLEWTWNDGVKVRRGSEELSFQVERLRSVA